MYQRWNGASYDLLVYDAERPVDQPVLVHSGDFSRLVSWSPDARWLLSVSRAPADRFTEIYSIVAFPAEAGAVPHVLLPRTEINWAIWGANGRIYWWEWNTAVRHSLDPPVAWTPSSPDAFQDRTRIVYVYDRQAPQELRFVARWFHASTEEERRFEYMNPGQMQPTDLVYDVFPDGLRFVASIPTFCGIGGVIDRDGRLVTKLGSSGCDALPFSPTVVTSDGRYVVGGSEVDDNGNIVSRVLYLSEASAAWKVPIENAPQGWLEASSRTGFSLAYRNFSEDSIYVGDLLITHGAN